MNNTLVGHAPVANTRPRLTDADRALILAVAGRELAQGKISIEEYEYLQDQCRVHPGAALVQRLLRLTGRGGVARFPFGQPGDPLLCVLPPHTEAIPVNSVVGSLDRALHLDRRFRPIHGGRARLESIRQAMTAGVAFPPIEVYRLDGACYVIDGHHRVAAALQVGQLYLDAVITECWPQREGIAHPVEAARVAFDLRTGLRALRLTTVERYGQALHQIHEHRWYLGERGRVVSMAEAAQDWYQVAYLPVVQQMIAGGLTPLRRLGETGDHYFALCELKERISRERGQEVGFAEAHGLWTASRAWRPHTTLRRRLREVRLI